MGPPRMVLARSSVSPVDRRLLSKRDIGTLCCHRGAIIPLRPLLSRTVTSTAMGRRYRQHRQAYKLHRQERTLILNTVRIRVTSSTRIIKVGPAGGLVEVIRWRDHHSMLRLHGIVIHRAGGIARRTVYDVLNAQWNSAVTQSSPLIFKTYITRIEHTHVSTLGVAKYLGIAALVADMRRHTARRPRFDMR
jgi:hypothetical protein